MSENSLVYSIQRTYILKPVFTPGKSIITCDQRIDIPTIEPLTNVQPALYVKKQPLTVIPCIELACEFLDEFKLTFETNEGVTVLPVKIPTVDNEALGNPYMHFRYVLVLPRGTTGVKSCKIIQNMFGEVQHNFTFGIMPPPYNYDNALFGYGTYTMLKVLQNTAETLRNLRIKANSVFFQPIHLPKGGGKQTIDIVEDMLSFSVSFIYPLSSEPTIHKPKITLHDVTNDRDLVYTLSLNKTENTVSIDLFAGVITAYDSDNGEIIQQFMLKYNQLNTLSFENFDDIDTSYLTVLPKGASVAYV